HECLARGLANGAIPAVFTTNPDECIERAGAHPVEELAVYRPEGFAGPLGRRVYHLHGICSAPNENDEDLRRNRLASLTNTLNSMGPKLPPAKHSALQDGCETYSLLCLGYSGSDPDVWYSLDEILKTSSVRCVYWCELSEGTVSEHLDRLRRSNPGRIQLFTADLTDSSVLRDLATAWGIGDPGALKMADRHAVQAVCNEVEKWVTDIHLTAEEQGVAHAWLLVQVGRFARGARLLAHWAFHADDSETRLLATLLCGYAYREMSMHDEAQYFLRKALNLAQDGKHPVRRLQAAHKLAESRGSNERFSLWHTVPELGLPWLPSTQLRNTADAYALLEERDEWSQTLNLQVVGRAGRGNALMNLGQFYRRVCTYWEQLPLIQRPDLRRRSAECLEAAERTLTEEGDMRSLAMVKAALAMEGNLPSKRKLELLETSIEIAEKWNQDDIQIGSEHFGTGMFLKGSDREKAEQHFVLALDAYLDADMRAELARTYFELWRLSSYNRQRRAEGKHYLRLAMWTMATSQGCAAWKIMYPSFAMLGWLKDRFHRKP
ncbi:MAG: SIR2 family protein, partial [Armatimonadota bacterium]